LLIEKRITGGQPDYLLKQQGRDESLETLYAEWQTGKFLPFALDIYYLMPALFHTFLV